MGFFLFPAIALGLLVHGGTLRALRSLPALHANTAGDSKEWAGVFGRKAAAAIAAGGRLPLTVFASTGLLVSAGYAFNEIFLYWFPNFAFAYLLLGTILAVNLAGPKPSAMVQMASTFTVVFGLVLLAAAGLLSKSAEGAATPTPTPSWPDLAVGVVLLLGFDLAWQDRSHFTPSWIAFFAVALTLSLWAWAGLIHLPMERLQSSSVPHLTAARSLLGQPGRWIMGGVIVLGSIGAVHALIFAVSRSIAVVFTPAGTSLTRTARIAAILLSVATAVCMGLGLAGSPLLETFIRAGMVLWLFPHLAVHAVLLGRRESDSRPAWHLRFHSLASAIGLSVAIGSLATREPNPWAMFGLLSAATGISLMSAAFAAKRQRSEKGKNS